MANQINTLPLSQLTLGAHSDFHTRVNNLIAAATAEALHIDTQAAAYATAVQTEASLVKRETAFVATASMKEADKVRDALLSTINAVVNAYQYTTIAAKKSAQQTLAAVIAPYKGIREHEYARETAEVTGLVTELTLEANAAHTATLGLTEEVQALYQANIAFDAEMQKKMAEAAARLPKSDISTAEARKQCDKLYAEIVQLVNAWALVQPSEALTQFVTDVNGVVEVFRSIAANTGKSDSTEEPEETTTVEQ